MLFGPVKVPAPVFDVILRDWLRLKELIIIIPKNPS